MSDSTLNFPRTIGIDLGSRTSSYCTVEPGGERIDEGVLKSDWLKMQRFFEAQPTSRVVIEASAPSRWVSEVAASCGHEVIVANPREFRLISQSDRKSDRNDARLLASYGQFRPRLLRPVQLRGVKCQCVRTLLAARNLLVQQRSKTITFVRSQVRNLGFALPTCASHYFHIKVADQIPNALRSALEPFMEVLASLAEAIRKYDREIARLCKEEFPETAALMAVNGVGPITSLAFVATIEDPSRFEKSRDVGPYVGLVPRSRASGSKAPQLSISKRGDKGMRRLLVSAATFILGPRGEDSDLRRWGQSLQDRGGQASRSKARIAVARKLGVLMHRLLVSGECYDPNRRMQHTAA